MALSPLIDDPRRQRLLAAMAASINPPDTPAVTAKSAAPVMPGTSVTPIPTAPVMATDVPVSNQTPSPRVGYSTKGLTGVENLLQRRKALEEADPESNVKVSGDFAEIEPPQHRKGFLGRVKSIGEGALTGLAMADPDNPNGILGSVIGGAALGGASPRGEKKLLRRFEMGQLDSDIARGLKLEQEGAQLGGMKALTRERELEPQIQAAKLDQEREIQNAKLEIERQKAAGLITKVEADRKQRELDRQSREKTNAAANEARIKAAEISAGGRAGGDEARGRKGAAAEEEFRSLTYEEGIAKEQKDKAYEALRVIKENPAYPKEDLAQAQKAAEDADAYYRSFAEKKRDAQTRIHENAPSGNAAPTTHGFSVSAWLAANPGKTEADAKAEHDSKYKDYKLLP